MCGIIGYVGSKNATPLLIKGLGALEYRGYDSAGLYVAGQGAIKRTGNVDRLARAVGEGFRGTAGIAHTRWATHGAPTEENAHPHTDQTESIWLVHNGIIENHAELRTELEAAAVAFRSDTDTEVLAQLIGVLNAPGLPLEDVVSEALSHVRGTYGIAVMSEREPDKLVIARLGSPLMIGVAEDGYYVASDASALLPHTREVIYLEDSEMAILEPGSCIVTNYAHEALPKKVERIDWDAASADKNGYEHFMLKEIMEIPDIIDNTLRGRLNAEEGVANLGGLRDADERLAAAKRIIITGCGSAHHAALIGQELIEEFTGLPVEVEIASELRYRRFTADAKHTVLLAVSQSGETADTLEAVRLAKRHGMLTLGVVNTVGSSIARETDGGLYTHAGPEIGVAATKTFVSQVVVLALIALYIGRSHAMTREYARTIADALVRLPEEIRTVLSRRKEIEKIARRFVDAPSMLLIGRRYQNPVALEGALKIKEIAYIHAEATPAGELKHGPLALIDEHFPVIALAPRDALYDKMRSSIAEIRARGGRILAITTDGNKDMERLADCVLYVPHTHEAIEPVLTTIPLQLLAYYLAKKRKLPLDTPRNLAKSVTVE